MDTTFIERDGATDAHKDAEIGQRIFKKLCLRMGVPQASRSMPDFKTYRNPDVIVLIDESAVLFEAQNWPATKWLYNRCNLSLENAQLRERVRVHPCQWEKILAELRTAGFDVLC